MSFLDKRRDIPPYENGISALEKWYTTTPEKKIIILNTEIGNHNRGLGKFSFESPHISTQNKFYHHIQKGIRLLSHESWPINM